jgi:transposase InsO family protein
MHTAQFPVERMCQVLELSPSAYYAWRGRPPSARAQANAALLTKIRLSHADSHQSYGSPRVHADLVAAGERCGPKRVARLMRLAGLRSKRVRRWKPPTTDSQHDKPLAPNRLVQVFQAAAANRIWLADITYIPTLEGNLYLAAVLDLFSRKIVGWALGAELGAPLCESALRTALSARTPAPGWLHHSDQGVQYASDCYVQLLADWQCTSSMSGVGNCYDNAPMESFFGTLKSECCAPEPFATRAEARQQIFVFIESFYNRQRRHSALGYLSPDEFEQMHLAGA